MTTLQAYEELKEQKSALQKALKTAKKENEKAQQTLNEAQAAYEQAQATAKDENGNVDTAVYQAYTDAQNAVKEKEQALEQAQQAYDAVETAKNQTHATDGYSQLTVVSATGTDTETFLEETENFFNRYYSRNEYYEVSVTSMESMLSSMTSMLTTVSLAIAVIAGISLLVGGIGVMNIMLVSITERTREIGTRKALGATNGSIRLQFIMESVVICLLSCK